MSYQRGLAKIHNPALTSNIPITTQNQHQQQDVDNTVESMNEYAYQASGNRTSSVDGVGMNVNRSIYDHQRKPSPSNNPSPLSNLHQHNDSSNINKRTAGVARIPDLHIVKQSKTITTNTDTMRAQYTSSANVSDNTWGDSSYMKYSDDNTYTTQVNDTYSTNYSSASTTSSLPPSTLAQRVASDRPITPVISINHPTLNRNVSYTAPGQPTALYGSMPSPQPVDKAQTTIYPQLSTVSHINQQSYKQQLQRVYGDNQCSSNLTGVSTSSGSITSTSTSSPQLQPISRRAITPSPVSYTNNTSQPFIPRTASFRQYSLPHIDVVSSVNAGALRYSASSGNIPNMKEQLLIRPLRSPVAILASDNQNQQHQFKTYNTYYSASKPTVPGYINDAQQLLDSTLLEHNKTDIVDMSQSIVSQQQRQKLPSTVPSEYIRQTQQQHTDDHDYDNTTVQSDSASYTTQQSNKAGVSIDNASYDTDIDKQATSECIMIDKPVDVDDSFKQHMVQSRVSEDSLNNQQQLNVLLNRQNDDDSALHNNASDEELHTTKKMMNEDVLDNSNKPITETPRQQLSYNMNDVPTVVNNALSDKEVDIDTNSDNNVATIDTTPSEQSNLIQQSNTDIVNKQQDNNVASYVSTHDNTISPITKQAKIKNKPSLLLLPKYNKQPVTLKSVTVMKQQENIEDSSNKQNKQGQSELDTDALAQLHKDIQANDGTKTLTDYPIDSSNLYDDGSVSTIKSPVSDSQSTNSSIDSNAQDLVSQQSTVHKLQKELNALLKRKEYYKAESTLQKERVATLERDNKQLNKELQKSKIAEANHSNLLTWATTLANNVKAAGDNALKQLNRTARL